MHALSGREDGYLIRLPRKKPRGIVSADKTALLPSMFVDDV
jgi:hypothetical protein